MNAIGTQLRDPINSGLTRRCCIWRFKEINGRRRRGNRERNPVISTRFSLTMEMSRLTRDGTADPVSQDQFLRRERGQGNINFSCSSADHEQDLATLPG